MGGIADLVDAMPDVGAPDQSPKKPHVIEVTKFAADGSSTIWCSCLAFIGSPEEHRRHRSLMGLKTPGPERPVGRRRVGLGPPKRRKSVATLILMGEEDL